MRSIIILCVLVAATAAVVIPFGFHVIDADGNVSQDFEDHPANNSDIIRIGRASCNAGACLNNCLRLYSPPLRFQCSGPYCSCKKL